MSDTPEDQPTRPISVAELLARHGNIGSPPVTGRKRRRRGNADAVSVAELTGEIPVIRDTDEAPAEPGDTAEAPEKESRHASDAESRETETPDRDEADRDQADHDQVDRDDAAAAARPAATDRRDDPVRFSEPQPRWPQSAPHTPAKTGPQRSPHPLPDRKADQRFDDEEDDAVADSDAEQMSPDPVDVFPAVSMADLGLGADTDEDLSVDDEHTDTEEAEAPARPAKRGLLGGLRSRFARGAGRDADSDNATLREDPAPTVDDSDEDPDTRHAAIAVDTDEDRDFEDLKDAEDAEDAEDSGDAADAEDSGDVEDGLWEDEHQPESLVTRTVRGIWVVVQSLLAVAFGAGLFIAFDQLWRWNSVVALVLTALVTLGLVGAVQAVRKTADITSTLIAVAVGLLVTLGPLVLWLSG